MGGVGEGWNWCEICTILDHLSDFNKILDVGCLLVRMSRLTHRGCLPFTKKTWVENFLFGKNVFHLERRIVTRENVSREKGP